MSTLTIVAAILAVPVLAWAGSALLGRIIALLPLDSDRRDAAHRWLPATQLALTIAVTAGVALVLFDANTALAAIGVVAIIVMASAWFAVRDIIAGVVLRAEHGFEAGQIVTFDGIDGRITHVGVRSLGLETPGGSRISVPWFRMHRARVSLTDARDRYGAQRISLQLPRTPDVAADVAAIRSAILHSFFSTVRREPHIRIASEDAHTRTYDVMVYTIDPGFIPAIEQDIRQRIDGKLPST